jgi:hypothetical protein
MEAVLLLVRVWRVRSTDGTWAFRACASRVASDHARFFACADELADYLQCLAEAASSPAGTPTPRGETR